MEYEVDKAGWVSIGEVRGRRRGTRRSEKLWSGVRRGRNEGTREESGEGWDGVEWRGEESGEGRRVERRGKERRGEKEVVGVHKYRRTENLFIRKLHTPKQAKMEAFLYASHSHLPHPVRRALSNTSM